MIAENQSKGSTESPTRKLQTVWMEKPRSIRLDTIRFNSLLKSKNSPILLRAIADPNPVSKSKTPYILAAALGVCLAIACYMLATSSGMNFANNKEYPRLTLPVAKHSSVCIYGPPPLSISWKPTGGWTITDNKTIRPDGLMPLLRKYAQDSRKSSKEPTVRVRIAQKESAKHFIHLTQCMEKAGITNLHISVFRPDA